MEAVNEYICLRRRSRTGYKVRLGEIAKQKLPEEQAWDRLHSENLGSSWLTKMYQETWRLKPAEPLSYK